MKGRMSPKHIPMVTGVILIIGLIGLFQVLGNFQKHTSNKGSGGIPMQEEIKKSVDKLHQQFGLETAEIAIVVNPAVQSLYVVRNRSVIKSFPVSTARAGIGCLVDSEKTPFGTHRIKEKIGNDVRTGTIFIGRENTRKIAEVYTDETDIPEDFVTTRIMWLDGQEDGVNRGKGCDTHQRYIYIHGTPEEGLIGKPVSHGCIRLKNNDVIELFNLVTSGTLVEIINKEYRPQS